MKIVDGKGTPLIVFVRILWKLKISQLHCVTLTRTFKGMGKTKARA